PLATVTLTPAEVVELPARSRATAVMTCAPSETAAVFHEIEYGAAVSSPPTCAPSTRNRTPATPTLSVALAVRVTVPATCPPSGAVTLTSGAMVSPPAVPPPDQPLSVPPDGGGAEAPRAPEIALMSAPMSLPSLPAFLYWLP